MTRKFKISWGCEKNFELLQGFFLSGLIFGRTYGTFGVIANSKLDENYFTFHNFLKY